MPPFVTKLEPWIEKLILSYGTEEQQKAKCRRLKAQVVGVAPMALSQQQAQGQGVQGGEPMDLLFLSDGVVQIPALLTASAWEDLQEREERDCLSGLLNTTVCVQSYSLQFHMNPEQTRCRFFLSVGKLATVAAGPPNVVTPSCTTLAPVRQQICKTWGSLLPDLPPGSSASQNTQCAFDLSNLLGAWQHDAMNSVLDSIQNALMAAPPCPVPSPQPSTSSCNPPTASHHVADTHTGWDVERTRYKSVEQFSIPACHLLMPEEGTQRPKIAFKEQGSIEAPNLILNHPEDRVTDSPETVQPIVDHFNTNALPPAVIERGSPSPGSEDTLSRDDALNEDTVTERNPWDAFSPPFAVLTTSTSCSGESITSEAIAPKDTTDTTGIALHLEDVPSVAVPPVSSKSSAETSQTSAEQKKEETSGIPPYQIPRPTQDHLVPASNSTSASGSATESACPLLVSDQENLQMETREEVAPRKRGTVKRKINHSHSDTSIVSVSSWSPPSWLFETQRAARAEVRSRLKQTKAMSGTVSATQSTLSTVHSDGTQFAYAYKYTGQLLQDLSKFKVADDMLHWAVKYLTVPNQTDKAHNLVSEQ